MDVFCEAYITKLPLPLSLVLDNVSHEVSLDDTVHEVLDVTVMIVLELVSAGDQLDADNSIVGAAPACVTETVLVIVPATAVTVPERLDMDVFCEAYITKLPLALPLV